MFWACDVQGLVNMQEMMTKYLLSWEMLMWKKLKVGYRKLLHVSKHLGKGGNNGSGFVLKVGCDIAN